MGYRGRASVALIAVVLAGSLFTGAEALGQTETLPPVPGLTPPLSPSTPPPPVSPPSGRETPPQGPGLVVPPALGAQPELGASTGTGPAPSSSPNRLRSLPTGHTPMPGASAPGNEAPAAGSQTTSESVAARGSQGGEVPRSLVAPSRRTRTVPPSGSRVAAASADRAAAVLRVRKSSVSSPHSERNRAASSTLADDGEFGRQVLVAWILGSFVVLTGGAVLLQRHEDQYKRRSHPGPASRQLSDDLWADDAHTVSVGMSHSTAGDTGPDRQLRGWHIDDPWAPWEHDENAVSGGIVGFSAGDTGQHRQLRPRQRP
jgi:hypothetical protein